MLISLGCSRPTAQTASYKPALQIEDGAPSASERDFEQSPSELYGELFEEVQLSGIFSDSKTFADAIARREPRGIMDRYVVERPKPDFDLKSFVTEEFEVPTSRPSGFVSAPGREVRQHMLALWPILTRPADPPQSSSSRLPLPYPYVVPGGRFDELYYWDSYFTMLGLEADGLHASVRSLCQNFVHLVRRYGHVPNGNRSYYLSRSQPPFLSAMMELIAVRDGDAVWREFGAVLEKEYAFWMDGADTLPLRSAERRVVRLSNESILNRYWDDRDTPRDESYSEDIATAQRSGRPRAEVYRNLRAAAESGWDFSSRWLSDGHLETIRTVALVPVDLNALLYGVEVTLTRAFAQTDPQKSSYFQRLADSRREAVRTLLWDEVLGAFADLEWRPERSTGQLTAATVVPLFVGLATDEQAARVSETIEQKLLAPHGLLTTLVPSGQQWDAPNGWAPLIWMAARGLRRYHHDALAEELERRWIRRNLDKFQSSGKLVEKYDVSAGFASAGGGEYPLQDGFGWTNGVLTALLARSGERARGQD